MAPSYLDRARPGVTHRRPFHGVAKTTQIVDQKKEDSVRYRPEKADLLSELSRDVCRRNSDSRVCWTKAALFKLRIFGGEISVISLDNVFQFLHSGFEKMKTLSIFRRESRSRMNDHDSQIRVYRSHAARAISEERWEVAEIFIDRILTVDPRHTEAWLMKGHLRHHCREDEQTAVDCYRKVINLCGPDSSHPHAQRARSSLGRLLSVWG